MRSTTLTSSQFTLPHKPQRKINKSPHSGLRVRHLNSLVVLLQDVDNDNDDQIMGRC